MDKLASHGPMIVDNKYGTYYRVGDVDNEIAKLMETIAQLEAERDDDFTRGEHDL